MKISIAYSLSRPALLAATMLLTPAIASAHPGLPGHAHGFAAGMAHPLSGLDHMLAIIAVGLWATQRGGRALWLIPLAFVSFMAFGGLLGMAGFGQVPFIDQAIAATVLILGIFVATTAQLPLPAAVLVVGCFAVFHGYAHGAEMPASASGLWYGLGFALATTMLQFCGLGLGLTAQNTASLKLARYAGCIIALCGLGWLLTA